MAGKKKKDKTPSSTIAINKKARFEYHLGERFEAGIALEGWEVKSLRAGRFSFEESYILLKAGEAFLFGTTITPMTSASTHIKTDPRRTRKLLLHKTEIARLIGAVERSGFTAVPTAMYWKRGKVKVELALAKGKQDHDKRAAKKEKEWNRDKQRILKQDLR